jgi:hypothetical protein
MPLLAVLGLGAAGGFSERTGEIREEQRRKDFDSFNAIVKAASAAGETDFFTQETMKSYKKLGGDEGSFDVFRQVAAAPLTQEHRQTMLASILAEREQAKTKGAVAGAQRQAVEEGGLEGLTREERVGLISPAAAQAGIGARQVTVQEQELPIKRQEVAVRSRLADIQDRQLTLEAKLGFGKLDVAKQLANLEGTKTKLLGEQLRGNLSGELITKGGFPAGEAAALADHMLGRKTITDEKLLAKVPAARAAMSDVNGRLSQSLNLNQEANKLLDKIQRPGKGVTISAADKASDVSQFNSLMIESLKLRASVQQMDDAEITRYLRNNLRFFTKKGDIVSFNEGEAMKLGVEDYITDPRQFGLGAESLGDRPGSRKFLGEFTGTAAGP